MYFQFMNNSKETCNAYYIEFIDVMADEFVKPDDARTVACQEENTTTVEGFEECATPFFPTDSLENPLFQDLYECLFMC